MSRDQQWWYYNPGANQREGPFDVPTMRFLYEQKNIHLATMVWSKVLGSNAGWIEMQKCSKILDQIQSKSPTPHQPLNESKQVPDKNYQVALEQKTIQEKKEESRTLIDAFTDSSVDLYNEDALAEAAAAEKKQEEVEREERFTQLAAQYESEVVTLVAMGYDREDVFDALGKLETKEMDVLVDFIAFKDDPQQRETIHRRVLNKRIRKIQEDYQNAQKKVKNGCKSKKRQQQLKAYRYFLMSITADKLIQEEQVAALQQVQRALSVNGSTHTQMLRQINVTEAKFQEMIQKAKDLQATNGGCLKCKSRTAEYIIFDCMHMCLCETCANAYSRDTSLKCPKCQRRVTQVKKTFRG